MTKYIILLILMAGTVRGTHSYVKTGGGSPQNGLTWGTAYDHPDSISNETGNINNNDTVHFEGLHYDVQVVCDTGVHYYGGNGTDNTITTGGVSNGGATLIGGAIVTGWGSDSSGVYPVKWADTPGKANTGYTANEIYPLIQIDEVNGDTLWFNREATKANLGAGEFYQPASNDSLYVMPTNMGSRGTDPADYKILGSSKIPMLVCNSSTLEADDVTIEGLHILMGRSSCIQTNSNHAPDNLTIRGCNLAWVNGNNANNTACIRGVSTGADTSAFAHNLHIVSDTFNHVNKTNSGEEHASGFETYSSNGGVVDSCVAYSDLGTAYHFKGSYAGPDVQRGNCVKHNVLYGDSSTTNYGIVQSSSGQYDSAYGNIIIGATGVGLYYRCRAYTAVGMGGNIFIMNNTFIGCRFGMVLAEQSSAESPSHIDDSLICKYNVFYDCDDYGSGSSHLMRIAEADTNLPWIDIDSNIYYNTSAQSWQLQEEGAVTTYNTLADWIDTVITDSHSVTSDPGFDSVSASNPWLGAARSACDSTEMDVIYGGLRWIKFGAAGSSSSVNSTQITGSMIIEGSTVTE